jgi:peptidyl-prolyl cis-trans isomerase D
LYAPNGDEFRYKMLANERAGRQMVDHWLGWLRQQAGITADWVPADEARSDAARRRG